MGNKKLRPVIFALLFFISHACSAAIVEASYSDWYWLNGKPAVNYSFLKVEVTKAESIGNGENNITEYGVYCSSTFPCRISIYTNSDGKRCIINPFPMGYYKGIEISRANRQIPFDEFNAMVKKRLPDLSGVVNTEYGSCKPRLWLNLNNGFDHVLASTDDGNLPLDPLPPVNVFCRIDGLSNGEIDFGVVNQESKTASINASLICDGNYAGQATARLIFTDANRSGGNTIILTNSQNKQQLKVKLSVDAPGASNKRDMTVKVGYEGSVELFASLDGTELKKETSGDFTGSAVIIFNVI
ncbi:UNVERIFIED_CONTAM: hypothetical protein GPA08_14285 [Serratia marcescens]